MAAKKKVASKKRTTAPKARAPRQVFIAVRDDGTIDPDLVTGVAPRRQDGADAGRRVGGGPVRAL